MENKNIIKVTEYSVLNFDSLKMIDFKALIAGDLHGSVIKLIDFFILCEFIEINNSNQYKEILREINNLISTGVYNYKYDIHNKIIDMITFKNSSKELILLGDVFGDRNFEDRLKLDLITKLNQTTNNKLTILFGNHDLSAWQILNNLDPDCSPCESDFEFVRSYSEEKMKYRQKFSDLQVNFKLIYQYGDFLMSHAPIRLKNFTDFNKVKDMSIDEILDKTNGKLYEMLDSDMLKHSEKDVMLNSLVWVRYNSDFEHMAQHPEAKKNKNFKYLCGHDSFKANEEHNLITLNNTNRKMPEFVTEETLVMIC